RPRERDVLVGEALHRDDGTEDLVLDHLVVLAQTGHDGGGEQVAALAYPGAAGVDGGVVGGAVEEAADPGELVGVVQRSVVGVGGIRAARGGVLRPLGERRDEVVVDAGAGQHAG